MNVVNLLWIRKFYRVLHNIYLLHSELNITYTCGTYKLEIGRIGMCNVHLKGSMSFALKLGQNWQE